jgi:hypothetical protein
MRLGRRRRRAALLVAGAPCCRIERARLPRASTNLPHGEQELAKLRQRCGAGALRRTVSPNGSTTKNVGKAVSG